MGKVKDLLMNNASNEEMNAMIDNARMQQEAGYVRFLENEIEIKDKALKEIKSNLNKMERLLNNNNK